MDTPSRDQYRLLFDSVPDPCLVLDPQLRIVAVNQAYLEATMAKAEQLIGRGMFEAFPDNPSEQEATGVRNLHASLNRVLKSRAQDVMAVQKYDIQRPAAKGGGFEVRYWSPINNPVLDRDGEVIYIIHRVQDVTEFVRSQLENTDRVEALEKAMRTEAESYNRAREIAEINLKLKRANDEMERNNRHLVELTRRLELEATARGEAQSALHQANEELRRSNQSLELFASVASHDLQEPLHTITSYTELLARRYGDKLDDRGEQYIRFILDGTNHMHGMINDLLAYSRVGTRGKQFVPVELNAVVEQAIGSLWQTIEKSRATIRREHLPKVQGDELQLTQLFQNLIANAVKFAKKDVPPEVRISCEATPEGWCIGVHDNGIGIEARFFDKIFDIFRRLHTRQEYEGTGIGLAICKRIVEHHGGRIWVESVPGERSSFYFTLRGHHGQ